jgi:hypothetical protein
MIIEARRKHDQARGCWVGVFVLLAGLDSSLAAAQTQGTPGIADDDEDRAIAREVQAEARRTLFLAVVGGAGILVAVGGAIALRRREHDRTLEAQDRRELAHRLRATDDDAIERSSEPRADLDDIDDIDDINDDHDADASDGATDDALSVAPVAVAPRDSLVASLRPSTVPSSEGLPRICPECGRRWDSGIDRCPDDDAPLAPLN